MFDILGFRARAIACALCLGPLFWALSSCGIDSVSFLEDPPRSVESSSDASIAFKGPASQPAEYLGVEIFYKLYDLESDAEADATAISTKLTSQVIPGDIVQSYLLSAGGLQYHRLSGNTYKGYPPSITGPADPEAVWKLLVPSDAATEIALGEQALIADPVNPAMYAYRVLLDKKPFSVRPVDGDKDYRKASGTDDLPLEYWVQLYASSYGVDLANYKDIYSNPVYIGRIRLSF